MGAWWQFEVGKRRAPVSGKNSLPDPLMLVFRDDDRFVDAVRREHLAELDRLADDGHEIDTPLTWSRGLMGYSATAGTLRSRLALQGFSSERVLSLCTAFFDDELSGNAEEGDTDPRDTWPEGRIAYPDGAAVTRALATQRGQEAATTPRFRSDTPEQQFLYDMWESLRESFDDPRFALALSLANCRPNTTVTLDLTDLVLGQYMDVSDRPHLDARTRMATAVSASGQVIVITEGVSDSRWLRRALELAAPGTAHLFEFLDFAEYQAPGGTDRVVSLTKGMAAAGVMNRVVAVLDNDTAGRASAQQLENLKLPTRFAVVRLPDVPYASHYPTLGPDGPTLANVNGRAASMEFMFGDDVLRDDTDCALFPIRWQSFNEAAADYQGRLSRPDKASVGQRLERALGGNSGREVPEQVLDGCRRLSAMLLAAAKPSPFIPASEFSDLTASWRNSQV
jgi:hypothetical protein